MCSTMKPRFAASAMMSPSLAGRLHRRLAGSRFDSKDARGMSAPKSTCQAANQMAACTGSR
jgi:hypothetical protein